MKTVYIVRHAKSSWDNTDIPDEERPLLEKGRKRTEKMIDHLLEKKIQVDYIISSHAVRALETARIAAHALKYREKEIKIDPHLYLTDADDLYDRFTEIPDRYDSAMIVGHNPSLSDFVNRYLDEPIDHLPTSGMVSISFMTDLWREIPVSDHTVNFILFPKDL